MAKASQSPGANVLFPHGRPGPLLTGKVAEAISLLQQLLDSDDPLPATPERLTKAADLLLATADHSAPSHEDQHMATMWHAAVDEQRVHLEQLVGAWAGPPTLQRQANPLRLDRWRRKAVRKRIGGMRLVLIFPQRLQAQAPRLREYAGMSLEESRALERKQPND